MKLNQWALLAEIVSSVAVVVTLVLVLFELRDNTLAIQAANRQSLSARAEEHFLSRMTAPGFAQIMQKTLDGERLSLQEAFIYRGWLGAILRITEEAYMQYEDGRLDDEYWGSRSRAFLMHFPSREARNTFALWASQGVYTETFAAWAEEALRERWGDAGTASNTENLFNVLE